ncbi:hypothetical protein HYV49_06360 [Candidatus Pacearchaeota archaeon]|nr:hypothetical protein [Candidatus Pacearchaeota archaeon]
MKEKEHIIDLLENTKRAIKEKNVRLLKELSNQTIHSASVYQDPDNIAIAVIIYMLSKIIERRHYLHKDIENLIGIYNKCISNSIIALKKDNEVICRTEIKNIISSINKLSGTLKQEIKDVLKKAKINKASKIYEHGISMRQTADLLGISVWELIEYAGKKQERTNLIISRNEKERIKIALNMFT